MAKEFLSKKALRQMLRVFAFEINLLARHIQK